VPARGGPLFRERPGRHTRRAQGRGSGCGLGVTASKEVGDGGGQNSSRLVTSSLHRGQLRWQTSTQSHTGSVQGGPIFLRASSCYNTEPLHPIHTSMSRIFIFAVFRFRRGDSGIMFVFVLIYLKLLGEFYPLESTN
jgi:hypothetical protein